MQLIVGPWGTEELKGWEPLGPSMDNCYRQLKVIFFIKTQSDLDLTN